MDDPRELLLESEIKARVRVQRLHTKTSSKLESKVDWMGHQNPGGLITSLGSEVKGHHVALAPTIANVTSPRSEIKGRL